MDKFFKVPFALSGDKATVPNDAAVDNSVSYIEGYGADYERPKTDPLSKNIERQKMNQILNSVTVAIGEQQATGVPDFITSALNGGSAYSYRVNAVVRNADGIYVSTAAANTAATTDATKWVPFLQIASGLTATATRLRAVDGGVVAEYPKAAIQINKLAVAHANYDMLSSTKYDFTGSSDPVIGSATVNDNSTSTGTHSFDHHHSFQAYHHIALTGGAIASNIVGYHCHFDMQSGAVTRMHGLRIENPTKTGGTIDNLAGVYIEALTQGTNNWGVFSEGPTPSFFGGKINLGSVVSAYASIAYETVRGHLELTPRDTFGVKIASDIAGSRKLILGYATTGAYDATIENASVSGDLELKPRTDVPRCVSILSPVKVGSYTVANLLANYPAASNPFAIAFLTDAVSTVRQDPVTVGGGTAKIPVFSNGIGWFNF